MSIVFTDKKGRRFTGFDLFIEETLKSPKPAVSICREKLETVQKMLAKYVEGFGSIIEDLEKESINSSQQSLISSLASLAKFTPGNGKDINCDQIIAKLWEIHKNHVAHLPLDRILKESILCLEIQKAQRLL